MAEERCSAVVDAFQSQPAGSGSLQRVPRLWSVEEVSELVDRHLSSGYREQGSNHPANLVSQESVADKLEIDAEPMASPDDAVERADCRSDRSVGNRERRHVLASRQPPHRGGEGVFVGDGLDRGGAQSLPWQVCFLPPRSIRVAFCA